MESILELKVKKISGRWLTNFPPNKSSHPPNNNKTQNYYSLEQTTKSTFFRPLPRQFAAVLHATQLLDSCFWMEDGVRGRSSSVGVRDQGLGRGTKVFWGRNNDGFKIYFEA